MRARRGVGIVGIGALLAGLLTALSSGAAVADTGITLPWAHFAHVLADHQDTQGTARRGRLWRPPNACVARFAAGPFVRARRALGQGGDGGGGQCDAKNYACQGVSFTNGLGSCAAG